MKSDCLIAVAAVLLSSQSVVAEPEHGGRGGSGGHGGGRGGHLGGFGFHRRHGGFFGGGFAPPMYPYPPPALPVPAPLPVAPAVGLPLGAGVPAVGMSGAASRYSMPGYPWLDGLNGIGPLFDDSVSYDFGDPYMWGKNRNLATAQADQAGAVTAQASANVQVGSAAQQPMGFVAQAPAVVGQVTSNRLNIASNLGASSGRSARMLNQGTEGLGIQVDGQGGMPQDQMTPPPPPPPQAQPPMQQPIPMPPQSQGGLVTKGFVRKSESYQEQKSGSKQSSKEFEKTTTPI